MIFHWLVHLDHHNSQLQRDRGGGGGGKRWRKGGEKEGGKEEGGREGKGVRDEEKIRLILVFIQLKSSSLIWTPFLPD